MEHDVIVSIGSADGTRTASSPGTAMWKDPDIPRCMSNVSVDESVASRYLARRVRATTVWPRSRFRKRGENGMRRSGRRNSTSVIRACVKYGSSARQTASTSGSSGNAS